MYAVSAGPHHGPDVNPITLTTTAFSYEFSLQFSHCHTSPNRLDAL